MTKWDDLIEQLRNWTMKTSVGSQEEYDNLWEEIDLMVKIAKRLKVGYPHHYKTLKAVES